MWKVVKPELREFVLVTSLITGLSVLAVMCAVALVVFGAAA